VVPFFKGYGFSAEWMDISIMAKELVPILFSCAILGPRLAKHVVLFQCDLSLVSAILKGPRCDASTKMYVVFCGLFDIDIRPEHIAGSINCTADHLSRNNMQSFSH